MSAEADVRYRPVRVDPPMPVDRHRPNYVADPEAIDAVARAWADAGPVPRVHRATGGTYVLASEAAWNDDGRAHDLVIVLATYAVLGDTATRVIPARITVNPELVDALREALDGKDA